MFFNFHSPLEGKRKRKDEKKEKKKLLKRFGTVESIFIRKLIQWRLLDVKYFGNFNN